MKEAPPFVFFFNFFYLQIIVSSFKESERHTHAWS